MRKILFVIFPVLFGLYLGLNELIGRANSNRTIEYWKPIAWEMTSVIVIMALVPLIFWFEKRHRLEAPRRLRTAAIHLGGAVAFSIVHVIGMIAIPIRQYRRRREGEVLAAELSRNVSDARLRQLTAQIDPHFIFNALNAISNRMHEDVEAADRMIARLADLMRAAYDTDASVFVELGREIELLRGYLALMAERFRGQLAIDIDVEPGLESLRVPRLLIQPIVENALKHGLASGRGRLRVEVRRRGDRLTCLVADDGVGIAAPVRMGTGLSNVSHRLELLFPAAHEFVIGPAEPAGTRVWLSIPATSA